MTFDLSQKAAESAAFCAQTFIKFLDSFHSEKFFDRLYDIRQNTTKNKGGKNTSKNPRNNCPKNKGKRIITINFTVKI